MDVVGLVGERSGKTTIHKVIVSEMKVSGGVVYVKGINVHSHKRNKFKAYKYMGYCPQLNYFEPQFTGRENLKIFCLIRGIRPLQVREISEELAENLNFKEHLNKRSKNYTVSDKRKLSIAIAVIGTPPLILLDEPTAGVEMAHRSDVLDILKGVNECGSSILLSSNNMEDFQSLCTRLVLLKRGKLVRIGPVESFKGNATRGLVLLIKIRPYTLQRTRLQRSPSNEDQSVQNITWFLLTYFERVYLLEKNQRDVIYYIYSTSIPLAKAFEIIEKNRVKLNISEYFLRQENMELTFVTQNFRILK
ncbi:ATP-binding cassette sub-family A member 3-like [Scaptodrosophila lebanonensis]|uniref:ATP-binding cassette sub-family A member 3-like n=1 Tax=Drosophila lebanonensis TaxID=7225 RepID=A0A6J2THH9_DROLE|nr:ATP-binding cassette sub-family A member 3-like [Scaptodrosophila lebanonensis]